jgi:hypothetical protein
VLYPLLCSATIAAFNTWIALVALQDNTTFITFATISQPGLSATRLTLVCDSAFTPASALVSVSSGPDLYSYLQAVDALQLVADIHMVADISLRGMPGITWPLDSITLRANVTLSGAPGSDDAINNSSASFTLTPVAEGRSEGGSSNSTSSYPTQGTPSPSLLSKPGTLPWGLTASHVLDLAMSPDLIMLRTRVPLVLQVQGGMYGPQHG